MIELMFGATQLCPALGHDKPRLTSGARVAAFTHASLLHMQVRMAGDATVIDL